MLAAETHVDVVDVAHKFRRAVFADVAIQTAAEIVGDVVFAVGKRACTAETRHYGTGRTTDTIFDANAVYRASALCKRVTAVEYGNGFAACCQFVCGVNSAGTCPDDDDVVLFHNYLRV